MLNPVTIQGTGPVAGRIPLRLVLQLSIGILKDHFLVEFNQILILSTSVSIVAGETRSASLHSHLSLDVQ